MTTSLSIPSYQQGFARSAGESEYPGLWRALTLASASFLGPPGGTLRDASGWQNHGTLEAGFVWTSSPRGWAVYNPTRAAGKYINVAGASSWAFPKDFAIVLCASITDMDWARLCSWGAGADIIQLVGDTNTGKLKFHCQINWGSGSILSDAAIDDGVWRHIVAQRNSSDGLEMWINGIKQTASDTQGGTVDPGTAFMWGYSSGSGAVFSMTIGQIYSRALVPREIQQLRADPYVLLRPRRRVFAVAAAPPAGRAHIVGSGVGTLVG